MKGMEDVGWADDVHVENSDHNLFVSMSTDYCCPDPVVPAELSTPPAPKVDEDPSPPPPVMLATVCNK